MSRRASRSSVVGDQGEFYLECKAVYLAHFDSLKDVIHSKEELDEVLHLYGRNLTSRLLAKYWTSSTDQLNFDDFMDICKKEKATTFDDLMNAFRRIDINGDGHISFDELYKIMSKGDKKMSRSEVKEIFDDADTDKNGKIDYEEFSKMFESTTAECKQWSRKMMEKKEKRKKKEEKPKRGEGSIGSQTSLRSTASHKSENPLGSTTSFSSQKKENTSERPLSASVRSTTSSKMGSRSLLSVEDLPRPSPRGVKTGKGKNTPANRQKLAEPSNLREWTHIGRKGMFFLEEEDNNIISHQYTLELNERSKVWVTIKPTTCKSLAQPEGFVDTAVYIIRNKPDIRGNYLEAFSLHKDSRGKQGIKCDLDAGTYHIIPFTTGCRLRKRTSEPSKVQKLLVEKDNTYSLSTAFKRALKDIFELADIDNNGYMNRDDFNWYNIRTSDEDVGDDEWEVVEERLELHDGEITERGFIQLNELEAEESKGDEDDMWVTLESMGFNKELQIDEAAPFLLDVYAENCDDMEVNVAGINPIDPGSGTLLAEKAYKAICQSVMEKGEKAKIKDMKDLYLYTYTGEGRATIMVENKSHSNVRVELDCSDSRNALSNQSSMEETFTAKSKSQMIAYHFVPEDDSTDWSIRCTESIRK